jgi:NTE family protein
MLLHAMSVMLAQRLYVEIEFYRERARVVVLPPPCPQSVQPIDFSHAGELIDRALAESRTFLDSLETDPSPDARTRPAKRLQPHSDRPRKPSRARSLTDASKARRPQATKKSRSATRSR